MRAPGPAPTPSLLDVPKAPTPLIWGEKGEGEGEERARKGRPQTWGGEGWKLLGWRRVDGSCNSVGGGGGIEASGIDACSGDAVMSGDAAAFEDISARGDTDLSVAAFNLYNFFGMTATSSSSRYASCILCTDIGAALMRLRMEKMRAI